MRENQRCERGDLNPQEVLPSLPPQGSVSANSTTSADEFIVLMRYNSDQPLTEQGISI